MVSTMKMVDTKKRTFPARSVSGVRVNRTGRRTYTLKYKLDVVRQCGEPGVSVAAIALAHRINANLVRRWIVRHRRALTTSAAEPQTMLPVTVAVATSVLGSRADDLVDASAKRRRPGAATIEIELYGARIHLRGGVDAQALRSVLDVLAQR
jgi:transposase